MYGDIIQSFNQKRTEGNERVIGRDFLPIKRFFALDNRAYGEGEIPVKYKELMGLVASAVLRCNDCIHYHLQRCHEEKCNDGEINEALNIALIVGGSIVIPHLRYAFQVWEALTELTPEDFDDKRNEGDYSI
jgi:AhpD family alkylhydroperoxidase